MQMSHEMNKVYQETYSCKNVHISDFVPAKWFILSFKITGMNTYPLFIENIEIFSNDMQGQ